MVDAQTCSLTTPVRRTSLLSVTWSGPIATSSFGIAVGSSKVPTRTITRIPQELPLNSAALLDLKPHEGTRADLAKVYAHHSLASGGSDESEPETESDEPLEHDMISCN